MPDFGDDDKAMIGWLEEKKALIWEGVAEDGEAMFRFDLDVLQEVCPPLFEMMMNEINEDLISLYKDGLVEVEYTEDLEAQFRLTEKGQKMSEAMRDNPNFPFAD